MKDFCKNNNIEFLIKTDDKIIKKFEKEFNISINIYSFDYSETFTRYPLHISDNQKDKHVNLLYYSDIEEQNIITLGLKNLKQ